MTPEDNADDSRLFGVWPTIAGFAFGFGVVALMFGLATGFH
jgi:hypothetical protein